MATRRANSADDLPSGDADRERDSSHSTWSAPGAKTSRPSPSERGTRTETTPSRATRALAVPRAPRRSRQQQPAVEGLKASPGNSDARASRVPKGISGGNAELVVTGLSAAAYVLISVAWLITALRNPVQIADVVGNVMFILGLWIAVAAGPLWFVGIMMVGREFSFGRRVLLYVVGILALIPWPYVSWAAS